jgi:integrase
LKKHQKIVKANKLFLGNQYQENNLVCCSKDGTPFHPSYVGVEFKNLAKKLGLNPIRVHDLRHSHATILLKLGENPKVIQERLGHESIQITLDIYSHVLPDMQVEAMSRVSNAFNIISCDQSVIIV